ncbi:sensor histidine kinase [Cohnella sp. GCM10020058]|uniref:cache domain-containing sensor histidine kinase n=1 Tax=Cohnella sp. GCM10020058 TaxID=3317330 RepID=UPI00363EE705
MRMPLRVHDISIKHKMMFSYGLLVLLSIVALGAAFYSSMQKYVYEQASESYRQTLSQVVLNTEYKLNNYDQLLNQFVSDSKFVGAVSFSYTSPGDYSYAYLNTISRYFEVGKQDNSIESIILYKNNPTLPESGDVLIDIDYILRTAWYQKYFAHMEKYTINDYIALSKRKFWIVTDEVNKPDYRLSGEKSDLPGEKRVAIIKPVIYNFEKLSGVFELFVRYDRIFGDFAATGTGPDDYMLVANDKWQNVYASLTDGESDRHGLTAALAEKTAAQVDGQASGKFRIKMGGADKMVLYERGGDSGWLYVRVLSYDRLFAGAKTVRQFTIVVGALCLLISLLLALALARMIARRLSVLSGHMKSVEDLTLDVKVDIDGRDEIGALARSYNRMIRKIRELVEQLTASQQTQRESELKALQTQINPHFLYNTLATINWMAMGGQHDKIIGMVNHLATFYRLSLNKGLPLLVVREEIRHLQAYTEIQKIRLEERINFIYEVEAGIESCMTLKLILQPFVENAILHGAEQKAGTTAIAIRARRVEDELVFVIEDDGIGMPAPPAADLFPFGNGYGIRNVHERIRLHYGQAYGVSIESAEGSGTKVTIRIPAVSDE